MADGRMLDVSRHEPRPACTGRTLRLDLEPEFRGPAGLQGAHAPDVARHGGGRGDHRKTDGCPEPRLIAALVGRSRTPLVLFLQQSSRSFEIVQLTQGNSAISIGVGGFPPYFRIGSVSSSDAFSAFRSQEPAWGCL